MPALTKTARDALPAEAFAVPARRILPIHDADHIRMAWGDVDNVRGVEPGQRHEARVAILAAAGAAGIDTAGWHRLAKPLAIQAMSVVLPEVGDHPNKHPFSGILVRLDEPSDLAPLGSGGRKIQITRAAAEAALDSLACMAVDFTPGLDGHDAQKKIGVITSASVVDEDAGPAIAIEGFFYAADFPVETARIHASASDLGFSFEARNIVVADPGADVLEITDLAFTGAAVLLKDKAAYHRTSLAAAADAAGIIDMTKEEMAALLGESLTVALAPLADRLDKVEAGNAALATKIEASRAVLDKVEPHAAALEAAAASMEAEGVGASEKNGFVSALKLMASSMRAEAAMGRVPSVFSGYPSYYAAAETKAAPAAPAAIEAAGLADAVAKAVADAVGPLNAKIEAAAAEAKVAKDALAASETKIADLQAKGVRTAPAPDRKTLAPAIGAIMARAGIAAPEGDAKLDVKSVDDALGKAGLTTAQRLQAKAGMAQAGLIA